MKFWAILRIYFKGERQNVGPIAAANMPHLSRAMQPTSSAIGECSGGIGETDINAYIVNKCHIRGAHVALIQRLCGITIRGK